jgi:flagellar biosynthesis/type III secretory pathway chaperone
MEEWTMGSVPLQVRKNLHRLLRREMSLYRDLLDIFRREKDALLQQALVDLTETNELKKDIISSLQEAEAEREKLVLDLAEAVGIPPEDVTLSKVTELLEDQESADLSEYGEMLSSTLKLCQEISQENLIMLEHSFDLVGSLITTITEPDASRFTYLPTGCIQGEKTAGHLVERRA